VKRNFSYLAVLYFILIAISLLTLVPLLTAFFTSLKSDAELKAAVTTFLPEAWQWANYHLAWQAADWGIYFRNSMIVTVSTVVGSLLLNSLSGYAFARLTFKGRDLIFVLLLVGLMVPGQVTIIPQFIIMKMVPFFGGNDWLGQGGTGWLNTHLALIFPELSGAFGVFLARQFYLGFPRELDSAAYIDGNGYFTTYLRIYLPISGPLFATLGILKTVSMWNDFFHPMIYINSTSMRTIQLGLSTFYGEYGIQFNQLLAATMFISLPIVIAFFIFQKYFVQSLVGSAVKG
jgi:multiple sugar transport system permease protein